MTGKVRNSEDGSGVRKTVSRFCRAELVVYLLILGADWLSVGPPYLGNAIKYVGILLCLITAWILRSQSEDYSGYLPAAMVFTAAADVFLLFGGSSLWGVSCFLMVQILYMLRLYFLRKPGKAAFAAGVLVRFLPALLLPGTLRTAGIAVDSTLILTVVYFTVFLVNTAEAAVFFRREHSRCAELFLIGLVLFLLCDINVGLFNMGSYVSNLPMLSPVRRLAGNLMWTFYLPSQVLLVISGCETGRRERGAAD